MFKFIDNPNLPLNRVSHCVVNENAVDAINFLSASGIKTFITKKSSLLDAEINSHSDLLFSYCGFKTAVIAPNQVDLIEDIANLGCRVEEAEFEPFSPYPNDVLLNQAFVGDYLISKIDSASEKIKSFANANNIELINVKQGYAKCSICVVDKKAIITEDNGIATLLKKYQFDVLKIKPDIVKLSQNHFGFLGGASGKLSKNELFFNGNIEKHPDYNDIKPFLYNYNVFPVYSKSYELTDIGSVIPITEIL